MFFSIFAIILSTIALLISYLGFRNKIKYQNPIIEVTSDLKKDTMYPTMNNYFSIFVKNFGEIPVTIDNPLTVKIFDLKGNDIITKIVTDYNLNVGKLPYLLKRGDNPLIFKIDSTKISDLLGSIIGKYKINWILVDNNGHRYVAEKDIKIKFEGKEGDSLIRQI